MIKEINGEKIALTLKFPESNPWLNAAEKYAVGNIIEGKVIIPPFELEKIAKVLGITKSELLNREADGLVPDLQYMKEFNNPDNLDRILDLMDEYVELKEIV